MSAKHGLTPPSFCMHSLKIKETFKIINDHKKVAKICDHKINR